MMLFVYYPLLDLLNYTFLTIGAKGMIDNKVSS
jgi:hypothetical protein